MSIEFTIRSDTRVHYLSEEFPLERGGVLTNPQIAFEDTGPPDGPVIVVLGGISAGRHITSTTANAETGWWEGLVGSGRAIDTDRFRVIGLDYLGGPGASTGPEPWARAAAFPLLTTLDMARATKALLQALGIDRVHRFIGPSFGGMVGLAFAAEFPDALDGLIAIGAAHESHPMASAWRSLQRRIVKLGMDSGRASEGLALARGLAMTTYRSHEEFGARFKSTPSLIDGALVFPVETYLAARGDDFAVRFSSEEFLALSASIDLHAVDPQDVRVPTWLIGFSTDQLVPIQQLEDLARQLGGQCQFIELDSAFGHDGFLKEDDQLAPILRSAVEGEVAR